MADAPSRASRAVQAPILSATLKGVGGLLEDAMRAAGPQVVPCTSPEGLEQALKTKALDYKLPLVGYFVQTTGDSLYGMNETALRTGGAVLGYDKEAGEYLILKASPIQLGVSVVMLTDRYLTMWSMIEAWHNRLSWGFQVKLNGAPENSRVDINVTVDKNLSVPERNPETGGYDMYRMVGTMNVTTYTGFLWRIPDVKTVAGAVNVVKTTQDQRTLYDRARAGESTSDWIESIEYTYVDGRRA